MAGKGTASPEELKRGVQEYRETVRRMENSLIRIRSASERTTGCWRGGAGDMDRAGFSEYNEAAAAVLTRLRQHAADLLQSAGIMEDAAEPAETLPEDFIV